MVTVTQLKRTENFDLKEKKTLAYLMYYKYMKRVMFKTRDHKFEYF